MVVIGLHSHWLNGIDYIGAVKGRVRLFFRVCTYDFQFILNHLLITVADNVVIEPVADNAGKRTLFVFAVLQC